MAKYGSRLSGRLSRSELEELIHNGEIETGSSFFSSNTSQTTIALFSSQLARRSVCQSTLHSTSP